MDNDGVLAAAVAAQATQAAGQEAAMEARMLAAAQAADAAEAAGALDTEGVRSCILRDITVNPRVRGHYIHELRSQRAQRFEEAIMWAVTHEHVSLLKCLCAMRNADGSWLMTRSWIKDVFVKAVESQQMRALEYLCGLPADRGVTPRLVADALHCAATNGNGTVVQYLCALPEERGVTAVALADAILGTLDSAVATIHPHSGIILLQLAQPHSGIMLQMCELAAGRGDAALVEAVVRAAATDSAAKLRFLCDRFAERDVMATALCEAVSRAATSGSQAIVQYLCELPAACGLTAEALTQAALNAAQHNHVRVLKYLCELPAERGVNPAANDNQALCSASAANTRDGKYDPVIKYLLGLPIDRGVDAGARGNTPFRTAVHVGNRHLVGFMCALPTARGVNPATHDNEPLRITAAHGDAAIVRHLSWLPAVRGVDPAACNYEALHCAAAAGHRGVVEILVEWLGNERDVNTRARNNKAIRDAAETATMAGYGGGIAMYLRRLSMADTTIGEPPSRAVKKRRRR